ncbi:DUF1016 N-terminal domain-containing protein [Chryseobacterium binzhouense]|uniref:DUF1016 N-terminal domain-containing protein n=1 Tax=Chryseobacterium binzhouense TaxID=2593646 RepID=UPI00117E4AD7|nr:DUF1016 N-terminal domain-containing protein [Chryseobacterium binzhouense]
MKDLQNTPLLNTISALLENARKSVVVAVNQTMVLTYFEIGKTIVEDEQNGEYRAEYGKTLLKDLSLHLTERFGKGFSVENLDRMRFFYKTYSEQISSTLLTNSSNTISQTLSVKFNLSWSHYLKLMRIKDPNERKFYEIESYKNNINKILLTF